MKNARTGMSARYLAALRAHLRRKRQDDGDRAQGLGRVALAGGLVPRDLALMHAQAVLALAASEGFARKPIGSSAHVGAMTRAGFFLSQALLPLEAAQRATQEANRQLQERNETLRRHAAALAKVNTRLEREVTRRKAGEAVIRKDKAQYQRLHLESQIMQRKLRLLTRQIISAQEEERKEISRELHDEVVQTLVGHQCRVVRAQPGCRQRPAHPPGENRAHPAAGGKFRERGPSVRPRAAPGRARRPRPHSGAACLQQKSRGAQKTQNPSDRIRWRRGAWQRQAHGALSRRAGGAHQCGAPCAGHARRPHHQQNPRRVRMEIRDNGKAFHVEQVLLARNHKRLGLIGMRERIEMVGGNLVVASRPGVGTTGRTEIPFDAENKQT